MTKGNTTTAINFDSEEKIKAFVQENWRKTSALQSLLGKPFDGEILWNFGSIPTEKARVLSENGRIVQITTWSGLSWTARWGYGNPTVDVVAAP